MKSRWVGMGAAVLWIGSAWAGSEGTGTAHFLKLGVGGRGVAMGEAQTAAVDDATALHWNPAGLGNLNQYEVVFVHNSFVQGISQDVAYYARPTSQHGTLGFGLSMLKYGDIAGYDSSGYKTGNVRASDTLLTLGWGTSMDQWIRFRSTRLGANVKVLRKVLDQDSAVGAMVDLGMIYRAKDGFFRDLQSGIVIQNLGPGLKVDSGRSSLPAQMKFGLSYPFLGNNLTVGTDWVLPREGTSYFNGGLDYRLWDILSLRAGYKGSQDVDTGLSYGVRLGNERMRLDYAFAPFGPFGDSHRVSLGIRFGKGVRQERVENQIESTYRRAESKYGQGLLVDAYMQTLQLMTIAPWHQPSKQLAKRIETEFSQFADESRRQQLLEQVNDHYIQGEQFFQLDDLLRAKNEFEAILALQPDHLGSKAYLNRIEERFKSIVDNFYEAAMRSFAAGDYRQSQEYLQRVLVVNPDHGEARDQLARVEMLIDKQAKVMEAQQRQERIRPLRSAAAALMEQKRYMEALGKIEEILLIDTTDEEALRARVQARGLVAKTAHEEGLLAMERGDYDKAQELLKLALRYDPDNMELRKHYAQVEGRHEENKRAESQRLYREALDAFLTGDLENALRWARKSLDLDGENLESKRLVERLTQKRISSP